MTQDDILDAKVGSTQVQAIYLGDELVWPRSFVYTYEVQNVTSVYSAGNTLYADGSNYVYFIGTVIVYINGEISHTLPNQRLTAHLDTTDPDASHFFIQNNEVHANNLGTTLTNARTVDTYVTYSTSPSYYIPNGVTQQANTRRVVDTEYETIYSSPTTETERYDYDAVIYTNRYNTSRTAAPASGGTTTITAYGDHKERIVTSTPWVIMATDEYEYTSGATGYGTPRQYDSGVDKAYGTPTTVDDTNAVIASITDSGVSGFWRSGLEVTIYSEGTTEFVNGRSITYTVTNGDDVDTTVVYQAKNIIETTTPVEDRVWDTETQITTYDSDYHATLVLMSYSSQSNPAPAGGGTAMLVSTGSHTHREVETRGYTYAQYNDYTWSSNAHSYSEPVQGRGSEVVSDNTSYVQDTPTPTVSVEWLHVSGQTVTIDSEADTVFNNGRSAQISITNGTATDSVTLYQQYNRATVSYGYDLAIVINESGNLPSTAGTYAVSGRCRRQTLTDYTSGYHIEGSYLSYEGTLSSSNCTAQDGSGNPISTVSGYFAFAIDVTTNTGSSRTVSISVSAGGYTETASKTQEAYVPPQTIKATVMPYIANATGGYYTKGKTYVYFDVTQGSLSSTTLTGVYFYYNLTRYGSQSQYSVYIGNLTVSETSVWPELVASGMPTFQTGDTINDAWFTVSGTGDVDTLTCEHTVNVFGPINL